MGTGVGCDVAGTCGGGGVSCGTDTDVGTDVGCDVAGTGDDVLLCTHPHDHVEKSAV